MRVGLRGGSFEGTPGMEASCEAVGLVSLSDQAQFSGVFCVFRAHVLDVHLQRRGYGMWKRVQTWAIRQKRTNLTGFEAEFDLHLAGLGAHPHIHLIDRKEQFLLSQPNKYSTSRVRRLQSLPLCRCPAT